MNKLQKSMYLDEICQLAYSFLPDASLDVTYFIACQFALESKFGTSLLATRYHNHCGMKHALARPSTNIDAATFAHYKDLEHCFIDYCYLLCYNHVTSYQLQHLDLFKLRLKAIGYCPDDDYISKIETLYNQFYN